MEVWQSLAYCTGLENRRTEMFREFESHRFRQFNGLHVLAGKYAVGHSPSEALVQFQRSPPSFISLKCYLVAFAVWGRRVLVRIQVGRPNFALLVKW